ncbi:MAG: shikimate kinase [Lysobacteraceae bacterium]|nr:MAG: shikimate kinase [Xanthomonadaceae bacterium]
MKILIVGNSGSGKSTWARVLSQRHSLPHLDLDTIVWEPGRIAIARAQPAVLADLRNFISAAPGWIIEGCYGDLIDAASQDCDHLIFLNPGLEACLANNRLRRWEPHKYASAQEQDAMLENLQAWVTSYYERDDAWSYAAHRRIFDAHRGPKTECRSDDDRPML